MSGMFDSAQPDHFVDRLPVIGDYRSKEMRRDADRRLRENLAQRLEVSRRTLTAMQRDLVTAGNLRLLPEMERAVGRLQLLIDDIRTAAYGYAPFFDLERVREAELDQLMAFDAQIGQQLPAIDDDIAVLAAAIQANEGVAEALSALQARLATLRTLYDQRSNVISSGALTSPAPLSNPSA